MNKKCSFCGYYPIHQFVVNTRLFSNQCKCGCYKIICAVCMKRDGKTSYQYRFENCETCEREKNISILLK